MNKSSITYYFVNIYIFFLMSNQLSLSFHLIFERTSTTPSICLCDSTQLIQTKKIYFLNNNLIKSCETNKRNHIQCSVRPKQASKQDKCFGTPLFILHGKHFGFCIKTWIFSTKKSLKLTDNSIPTFHIQIGSIQKRRKT